MDFLGMYDLLIIRLIRSISQNIFFREIKLTLVL